MEERMPPEYLVSFKTSKSFEVEEIAKSISAEAILVVHLLNNETMTVDGLIGCLMSDPYNISFADVLETLQSMVAAHLLELDRISENSGRAFKADVYLKLACF